MKMIKAFMAIACVLLLTSFAKAQEKAGKKDTTHHAVFYSYSCPMHPNFVSDKPGKCPRCGMDLVQLSPKEQLKKDVTKTYTCPIHAEVISTEPGKCPKCNKDLTLSPKERMKADVVKLYSCGMHPDQTSDKPGKCPICGMEMVEKKTSDKQEN
jgi:transcription initiation factor IIE alpha subunit